MPILNAICDLTYLLVAVIGAIQRFLGLSDSWEHASFLSVYLADQSAYSKQASYLEPYQVPNLHWIVSSKSLMNQMKYSVKMEALDKELTGQVSFNHVDFQYVEDKPMIVFNLESIR